MAMNNDFKILLKTELDAEHININIDTINTKLDTKGMALKFQVDTNYIKEQLKSLTVNLDSKVSKAQTPKVDMSTGVSKQEFQEKIIKEKNENALAILKEKNLQAQLLLEKKIASDKLLSQEKITSSELINNDKIVASKELAQKKLESDALLAQQKILAAQELTDKKILASKELNEKNANERKIKENNRVAEQSAKKEESLAKQLATYKESLRNQSQIIGEKLGDTRTTLSVDKRIDLQSQLSGIQSKEVNLKTAQPILREYEALTREIERASKKQQALLQYQSEQERTLKSVNRALEVSGRNIDEISKKTKGKKANELKTEYDRITNSVKNYTNELEKNNSIAKKRDILEKLRQEKVALQNLNHQTSLANKNSEKFTHTMASAMKKFSMWLSAGTIVMQTVKALQKMVDTVIELDKAFTNIQMVTGYTNAQIKELQKSYIGLAQSMGTTVQEVASGANEWLRQNKTIAETNEALRASIMFSKVAMISNAEATTLLTSAMKGYKLEVRDLVSIVDKLSAVDMKSASSSQDLAIAMSYGASVANAAGISFDKYIAYIATAKDITQQSAETIGTALKSIIVRMGQVKAGVDVDELGESLNNVEIVLKKNEILLRDEAGEFRNFEVVLDEVAGKWKTFTKVQQNQIVTALAGQRQANVLSTIFSNYGQVLDLTKESLDSAGQAQEKYDTYLESTDAKLNKLKTAFAELATTTINSDFVKGIIDITRGLVEFMSSVGGLVPILTSVLGVLILIKREKSGIKSLGTSVVNLITKLHLQRVATKGVGMEATRATLQLNKMSAATKATASVASLLSGALGLVTLAISLISMGIQKYNADQEKALQTNIELNNQRKEELETLESLKKEYIDLSIISNKTDTQKKRLKTISEQLIKTYGIEAGAIDLLGNSYDVATAKFREMEKSKLESAKIQNQATQGSLKNKLLKEQNWDWDWFDFKSLNITNEQADEIMEAYSKGDPLEVYEVYKKQYDVLSKTQNKTEKQKKAMEWFGQNIVDQKDMIAQYKTLLAEDKAITDRLAVLADKTTSKAIDDLAKDMAKFSITPIEKQIDLIAGLEKRIAELKTSDLYKNNISYKEDIDKLTESFEKQAEAIKNTDFALNAMNKEMSALKKQQKLEQEELKLKEKLLAVEKAREELAKAKDQRVRIFRAGKGFVYEQDFSVVENAQKNLDKAEMEVEGTPTEKKLKELEKLQEIYNQAILDGVKINEESIREYFLKQENLKEFEALNYKERIELLKKFLSDKSKLEYGYAFKPNIKTSYGSVFDEGNWGSSGQFGKIAKGDFGVIKSVPSSIVKNFNNKQVESGDIININGAINLPNVQDSNGFINAMKRISISSLQKVTSRR